MKTFSEALYRLILSTPFLKIASVVVLIGFGFLIFKIDQSQNLDFSLKRLKAILVILAALTAIVILLCLLLIHGEAKAIRRINAIHDRQTWLLNSVNFHLKSIYTRIGLDPTGDPGETSAEPRRWPWGEHHTEHLGHLEAAARRYWTLYDKSDLTTAPTNEMVAEWLQSERNVSKDKAKAIASILRADGLPTGRRG